MTDEDFNTCTYEIAVWKVTRRLARRLYHMELEGLLEHWEAPTEWRLCIWATEEQKQYQPWIERAVKAEGCEFRF